MKKLVLFLIYGLICLGAGAQNVGVGIINPQSRFHVNGTAWFQGDNTSLPAEAGSGIGIGYVPGSTAGYIFAFNYSNFTPRNLLLQHPGGSVIIGSTTNTPLAKVDIRAAGDAVYGATNNGNAITGISATNLGMYAVSNGNTVSSGGLQGEGWYVGVQGNNTGTDANRQGIRGQNSSNAGGYAGLFVGGSTWVAGTLFKNAGAFYIDHPVEPETKFLVHSFVESPDMKNIYDGIATTNAAGLATVQMPSWFQALNMAFRYQLTCIGQFAHAIVASEIANNSFVIKTDKSFVKVSWQVTGTRQDPWARDNRLPVEKMKTGRELGHYIYPEGYGLPAAYQLPILKPTNLSGKIIPQPQPPGSGGKQ